ncbi:MAG: sodium:proton antiporter, partial [Bacteroidaceae bacterium]|nr:sodium:proton antiporter [Bacteroidaceae bacterium]
MTLIIVAVLFIGFVLMSTEQMHHINRATVAMVCGVVAWVIYLLNGEDFVMLMHQGDYEAFLAGGESSVDSLKYFVAEKVLAGYVAEACSVILFLIATN